MSRRSHSVTPISFQSFADTVRAAGLQPVHSTPTHWRIIGGQYEVNYYPESGTLYVNGMSAGVSGSVLDAIAAATNPLGVKRSDKQATRKKSYSRIKWRLLQADPRCHYCQCGLCFAAATIDHRIPLASGGTNGNDNLVLACHGCNKSKGAKMPHNMEKRNETAD